MESITSKILEWFEEDVAIVSTTEDLNADGDVMAIGGEMDEFSLNSAQVAGLRYLVDRGDVKVVGGADDGDYGFKIEKATV